MTVIIHVWEPKKGNSLLNVLNWFLNHLITKINKNFELPDNVGHTSISVIQSNGIHYYSSHTTNASLFRVVPAGERFLKTPNDAIYKQYFKREYNRRVSASNYSEFVIEGLNEENIINFLKNPKIGESFDFSRYSIVENCCLYTLYCLKKGLNCTENCNLCNSPGNYIYGKRSIIRVVYKILYLILVFSMICGGIYVINKIVEPSYLPIMSYLSAFLDKNLPASGNPFTGDPSTWKPFKMMLVILRSTINTFNRIGSDTSIFEKITYFMNEILNNKIYVLLGMFLCYFCIDKFFEVDFNKEVKFGYNPGEFNDYALTGVFILLLLFLVFWPFILCLLALSIIINLSYILLKPFRIWTPIDVAIFIKSIGHKFFPKIEISQHLFSTKLRGVNGK